MKTQMGLFGALALNAEQEDLRRETLAEMGMPDEPDPLRREGVGRGMSAEEKLKRARWALVVLKTWFQARHGHLGQLVATEPRPMYAEEIFEIGLGGEQEGVLMISIEENVITDVKGGLPMGPFAAKTGGEG